MRNEIINTSSLFLGDDSSAPTLRLKRVIENGINGSFANETENVDKHFDEDKSMSTTSEMYQVLCLNHGHKVQASLTSYSDIPYLDFQNERNCNSDHFMTV